MEAQHDIKNAYHEVPMDLGMVVGHFRHRHGNFLKKQSGFGETGAPTGSKVLEL